MQPRERNEIGLNNFVGRLFAQIQGLNAQEASQGILKEHDFIWRAMSVCYSC